jgi:hypothetical protein
VCIRDRIIIPGFEVPVWPFFQNSVRPIWRSERRHETTPLPGKLDDQVSGELWIWRPIIAGKVSLSEVKSGVATIEDLQVINAILDMQTDLEASQYEAVKGASK